MYAGKIAGQPVVIVTSGEDCQPVQCCILVQDHGVVCFLQAKVCAEP